MKSTIIIPCAGSGVRMGDSSLPKPLIPVNGKPIVQWAVESLQGIDGKLIFVILKEHDRLYNLRNKLKDLFPDCVILSLSEPTSGMCKTVLEAKHLMPKDSPLIITSCDQYYEWNAHKFSHTFDRVYADGAILNFKGDHPKWSYARLDEEGYVAEVAEKKVISNLANVGTYFYRKGSFFVDAAYRMMAIDEKTNGEWYVAPTFNHMIFYGARIISFMVDKMVPLGTKEDLEAAHGSF